MPRGEPLLDLWLPATPKGKGRPIFRTVPRSKAPYVERVVDPSSGYPLPKGSSQIGKLTKHYALKNVRPMAYGESTTEHEAKVRAMILDHVSEADNFRTLSGPITVDWVAYFPPLLSDPRREKERKSSGLVSHFKKPDIDNIEKLLLDAMSELVFLDDCQINFGTRAKVYSHREGIRARVYITDLEEVRAWVANNFPWEDEPFSLSG